MLGRGEDGKVYLELDLTEASHLFSILLHAKFGDGVDLRIVGTPTMRSLLDALFPAYREAGGAGWEEPTKGSWLIDETTGGTVAPSSFEIIESLKEAEGLPNDLEDSLYPYRWIARAPRKRHIERGKVVILAKEDIGSNHVGVCIGCWQNADASDMQALIAWVEKFDEDPANGVELKTHAVTELRILY